MDESADTQEQDSTGHIAHAPSDPDQPPFINYCEHGRDGLQITAAFSLNNSSHYYNPGPTGETSFH